MTTPGGLWEGSCLLPAPGPWEYEVPISAAFAAFIVAVTKDSTRGQHFFMFRFHFSFFWTFICTKDYMGFPSGSDGKATVCNAGDLGSIPGLERSPGEGNDYPLQYPGLENPMDRARYPPRARYPRM